MNIAHNLYHISNSQQYIAGDSRHWVQRSGQCFRIFEIIIFCFVVAIYDLVHALEAMYGIPFKKEC